MASSLLARAPSLSVAVSEKRFKGNAIFHDITFEIQSGEVLAILGHSRSGKTTLLRMIAGLDLDFAGKIEVDGVEVGGPSLQTGVVFQESRLLPWKSVLGNIEFAIPNNVSRNRGRLIRDACDTASVPDNWLKLWPRQLSGGMSKRVSLARSLVSNPSLLLLDEPFSALDSGNRFRLQTAIESLIMTSSAKDVQPAGARRQTVLVVTHDIEEAVFLADRILFLSDSSPSTFQSQMSISLPRPRERHSSGFATTCRTVLEHVLAHE